jgi:hypothetical protein
LQLKTAITIVFVFDDWAQGFFEAGQFVPLHSAPCLFVCIHTVQPGGKGRMCRPSLQFPKGQQKLQNDPPFALNPDCTV